MRVLCSPKGLMDFMSPKQGVTDILRSGMDASVIDFSLFCDPFIMERYGWDLDRMQKRIEMLEKMIAICKEKGLSLPLAQTTYLRPDTKRQRGFNFLRGLAEQAVRISGEAGAEAIIVYPLTAGVSREELWRVNRDFFSFLSALGNRLKVLHIHDNDGRADLHQLPFTFTRTRENVTSTDWEGFLDGLGAICFDGVLSFETAPVLKSFPEAMKDDALSMIAKIGRYFDNELEAREKK